MGTLSHRHHYLPQGSQRPFADSRGRVAAVATDGRRFGTTPHKIGVQRDLYQRNRPSGERSDDIERVSLGNIESEAFPILQRIDSRWPLSSHDKGMLARFVGVQLVRVPRWFAWHESFAKKAHREHLDRGDFRAKSEEHDVSEVDVYRAHVDMELDGTRKLLRMLSLGAKAGTTIGSMTWSLLRFDAPRLALADHPVVVWPLEAGARFAGRAEPASIGLLNFLEVRLPIAPDAALLMAWGDRPDTPNAIHCRRRHAENLNAFTIAEAEHQWIHVPGKEPRSVAGPWQPLAPELLPGYSVAAARDSVIRADVSADLNANLGDESREVNIRYLDHATNAA